MTSRNAAKGKRWELATVRFLAERLRGALRPRQEGHADLSDVHTSLFALQCKDEARHDFSGYLRDAEVQRRNSGQDYGAAVVKRRNHGTAEGYVVMTLSTFRAVHARLDDAEDLAHRFAPADDFTDHVTRHRGEITP